MRSPTKARKKSKTPTPTKNSTSTKFWVFFPPTEFFFAALSRKFCNKKWQKFASKNLKMKRTRMFLKILERWRKWFFECSEMFNLAWNDRLGVITFQSKWSSSLVTLWVVNSLRNDTSKILCHNGGNCLCVNCSEQIIWVTLRCIFMGLEGRSLKWHKVSVCR